MRILKISDVYFPRVNGVSTSIRTFAREFHHQGHHVGLIAPSYPSPWPEENFEIHRIPSRYLPLDPEDRLMRSGHIRALLPRLRQASYDVLHIHTPFVAHYLGTRLGRALDIPVVETYHTYFEEYLHNYLPLLPRQLLRFAARRLSSAQCNAVDALVVPTQPMLEVLRDYGVASPVEVIPTGIPMDELGEGNPTRFRHHHGIPDDRPVMLYVGRVAHEKNIDLLLDVLAKVRRERPDILLIIAGEGPARTHLERRAARMGLGDSLLFVGYLSRDGDLGDCYAAGDIFVFASRTETQGLVLLESMLMGTPVVTTAVLGTAEVMRDGRGGLVASEDATDFANKCLQLLTDHTLRRRLAEDGRRKAGEWSAPAMAHRMLALYADLREGAQRTAA